MKISVLYFAVLLSTVTIFTTAQDALTPAPTDIGGVDSGGACTISDNCGDGLFCSSAVGLCLELTCQNWVAGAPHDEPPYNEAACAAEVPAGDTREYFCGNDGNCYSYNCEDWYMYGPLEFTRFDPFNPVPLVCSDYSNGEADHMNSVVYGCRPYQPGSKAPEAVNYVHYFNQECKATPRGTDDFKCYQNKPGTNYNNFQADAGRLNPPSCDRNIFGGPTEDNLFWYQVVLRQINKGEISNYKQGRNSTSNSLAFVASEADNSMFAVLETNEDIPPPTSPPIPPPNNDDSSTSMAMYSRIIFGLTMVATGILSL